MRPDNIDVNAALANIYYKKADYKSAENYINKAMRTRKQDPALWCLAGLIKYKQGSKAEGQQLIKKSLALDPYNISSIVLEGRQLVSSSIAALR